MSCSKCVWRGPLSAAAIGFLFLLGGCASAPLVKEARGLDTINAAARTCVRPHHLTQDCSNWSGPTRLIEINGQQARVAATQDGAVILLMGPTPESTSLEVNEAFAALRAFLKENGVDIYDAQAVISGKKVEGYYVFLIADGYSLLRPKTVKMLN